MLSALSLVTPDHCISQSRWGRPWLPSLAPQTLRATAPIGRRTTLRRISSYAARKQSLPTSVGISPTLLCFNSKSPPFSPPFVSKSRCADEPSQQFLHALACSARIPAGRYRALVFSPCAWEHLARWVRGPGWPLPSSLRRGLSAQTGSSHHDGALCLHAQSPVSR